MFLVFIADLFLILRYFFFFGFCCFWHGNCYLLLYRVVFVRAKINFLFFAFGLDTVLRIWYYFYMVRFFFGGLVMSYWNEVERENFLLSELYELLEFRRFTSAFRCLIFTYSVSKNESLALLASYTKNSS